MPIAVSRRLLLKAGASATVAHHAPAARAHAPQAQAPAGLVEPRLRLKARSASGTTVCLTLDACPGGFDTRIADVLVANRIPATIFVTGAWLRRNPEAVAFLLDHPKLFGLANHGDHHLPPVLNRRKVFGLNCAEDMQAVERDVVRGADDIQRLTGVRPLWYRAATGFYSPSTIAAIENWGYAIGGYSLNGDEGASLPAQTVARRIAAAVDGDIIISHMNQPSRPSGQGVAEGVLALKARGVRFERLDQLGVPDVLLKV